MPLENDAGAAVKPAAKASDPVGDQVVTNDQTGKPKVPAAEAKPVKADPFGDAFKAAQADLGQAPAPTAADEKKPAPEKKAKPAEKPAPKAAEKVDEKKAEPAKKAAKPADDDDDDGDDGDDEKPAPKKAEPLKPKRSWSARRQDDFRYLDPETQAAWLSEPTKAPEHWSAEEKEALEAITDEGLRDNYVHQRKSLEKGFQEKFTALAEERKTYDRIKAAVPDVVRAELTRRGLGEADAFEALVKEQQRSMNDPVGYVAGFIARNKVDVNAIADRLTSGGGQQMQPATADIHRHPEFVAMKAKVDQLEGAVRGQFEKTAKESSSEADNALKSAMEATDDAGGLRYPFIRVLGGYMADLMEDDPETFAGMKAADRLDLAYRTAVDAHPELKAASRTAKKAASADEQDDDADAEELARTEKLKTAQTRKPRAPQTTPGKGGDAFSKAFNSASKQLGHA